MKRAEDLKNEPLRSLNIPISISLLALFKKIDLPHIRLLPEQHLNCAECDRLQNSAILDHLFDEAPFLNESSNGATSIPLENRQISIQSTLVAAFADANVKDIEQIKGRLFYQPIAHIHESGTLDKIPKKRLSATQQRWMAYLKRWSNGGSSVDSQMKHPETYFEKEINKEGGLDEYRGFTRLVAEVNFFE